MLGPILNGGRVRLIPPTPEMLPLFIAWLADMRVTRYVSNRFPPSLVMETEWFDKTARSKDDIIWAIAVGDKIIGTSGLHQILWLHRNALTGTLIGDVGEWGKGYASEAALLRTRFAFEELGMEKLKTEIFTENEASRRALTKSGYRECGVLKREEWRQGRWHDVWLGELHRDDWLAIQEKNAWSTLVSQTEE